ncbi:MAG: PAS domain-containing protein [Burkholderiales bacterium]|nr:PAS domain-containing protein [Burkholderiales bacterium]
MAPTSVPTNAPAPAPAGGDPWWPWRSIALGGSLFILAIAALSVYDIVRGYHQVVAETGRDLQSQARVIAEQAARSLQAVDGVLRQVSEDSRGGALHKLAPAALHAYLRNQAQGLVQADALSLFDAEGRLVASSATAEPAPPPVNLADDPAFQWVRAQERTGPLVAPVRLGRVLTRGWFLPMARRVETADGRFAGAVVANVRVDYFQNFYRDVRPEPGTAISLVHRDGTLVARHPAVEESLGRHFAGFDLLLPAWQADARAVARAASPQDNLEYFGVREDVAEHPLAVVLTRATGQALAAWRDRSIGSGLRTLALVLLAVALLSMLRWQLLRLARMRASLELSRERFALAAAGSEEGIWDWDVVTDTVYTSPRAREIFGVGAGPETQPRARWHAQLRLHPDDLARRAAAMEDHMAGRTPVYAVEYRVRRTNESDAANGADGADGADGANGTGSHRVAAGPVTAAIKAASACDPWRWVRVRGLCVRDAGGQPQRMAGSVTDIDARRRAEAALRESEERYAFAMSGSNEGHWVWDFGSRQIYVSAKLAQLFGMGEEARVLPAQAYFEALPLHPEDRERVQRARDDHVAGLTPRLDHEFRVVLRRADGTTEQRWVHTRAQCFRDAEGRPLRLAGSTVDVTDRKRAEEALRESEQRFAIAVAGADDGIWDFDYVHNRVFGSRRAREILGIRLEPVVQSFEQWFDEVKLHPEDAAERLRAMQAHLDGRTPAYEGEWRVLQHGGGHRWVRVRGVCVRDAEGKPLRMAGSVSDIDARKRAEESLRRSEERYALAVAGSDDGVWDWDFDAGIAFESARARQLQGLPPGPEVQPVEELVRSLRVHPEDAPRRAEGIRAHLAGETPAYECDYRVLHDDGEYRWIHVRALCVRDATGRPYRMAGSVTDIDARKRAEEARRASEERFALAVAGSKDGILDWDVANDRMYVSERALQIVGLPAATPIATQRDWAAALMPRLHPDDAAKLQDELRAYPDAHPPLHEGEYRVRDNGSGEGGSERGGEAGGGWRWIRFRGMSIRDALQRPVRWAGSLSDIDAQKKAEEALRRSDERYQLAVAGSDQGLWDWDLESDSLFLSPRAQQLLWVESGAPQRPRREWIALTPYHPDDVGTLRDTLVAYLRGDTRSFKVEYRVRHHRGGWHWYRQRGIAVRDAQGRPTRMAGSMEDITDRKNADAERDRLEAQLRQAQKLEAIGTLAGGIAHDFNNILAAILGYGEMAVKDAPEGSSQRRHIEAAVSAGMRAKSLVERILAFSRSGIGERIPVHVQSVVGEALDQLQASLPAGITVQRRLHSGDSAVLGDPTQVHQVVMNLCANAVQAMRSQGTLEVALERVHEAEPECMTGPLPEGDYVRLRVRDTGCGIASQVLERIFDPFFTTKEVGVGTGLGLSLVHGIVSDLGGGIGVVSELGVGSTFTVFLPWQEGVAPPAKEAPLLPQWPAGHGETVLLVDDEEALVRLGEEMIAELGYEPVGFTSGRAALATFRAAPGRFDAVLSDESMPEMTGSELARAIRAIRDDIPIVLMSGFVTPALNQRARDTGVAEVLAKPLVARDIARSLAGALRNGG